MIKVEYAVEDDSLYRRRYEIVDGKKFCLFEGKGHLVITKDEFLACIEAWLHTKENTS